MNIIVDTQEIGKVLRHFLVREAAGSLGHTHCPRSTGDVLQLERWHFRIWRAVQGLELAVPGTYIAGEPVVTIAAFAPQLHVITSKQRPRKLTIHGSDGAEYMFLLKAGLLMT